MTKNWIFISFSAGIVGGLLSLLLTSSYVFSSIIFFIISGIVLANNPNKRYMTAFWALLSVLLILNKYTIAATGKLFGIDFNFKMDPANIYISIMIGVLCITCLILDFLEKNDKLGKIKLFSTKKIKIQNKGDSYYSEGDINIKNKE